MSKERICIVDDDPTILEGLAMALEDAYEVRAFSNAEDALAALPEALPDLILLDVGLPGQNGVRALEQIRSAYPNVLAIMITAYEDMETVVAAMRLGAYDYVVKPLHMDALETRIRNALQSARWRKEVERVQEQYLREHHPGVEGASQGVVDVMDMVARVAASPDTPVLIRGETGTGKEWIASAIHYRSPNYAGPFVAMNCAALPQDLVESELFGYDAGAFSGASSKGKKGLIEEAAGGTLFLDEVGDLEAGAQAKLLRFLEEGEFYKVGSTRRITVRTRVVSATNKDLEALSRQGAFRKDLYFRLGVVTIRIPSLNERREDIAPLAEHFLAQFCAKFGRPLAKLSDQARQALYAHDWQGNIRELRNAIERSALLAKAAIIQPEDLGLERRELARAPEGAEIPASIPPDGLNLEALLHKVEARYLLQALNLARGNQNKAAALLGLNHHTFRYRLKKLGIN